MPVHVRFVIPLDKGTVLAPKDYVVNVFFSFYSSSFYEILNTFFEITFL